MYNCSLTDLIQIINSENSSDELEVPKFKVVVLLYIRRTILLSRSSECTVTPEEILNSLRGSKYRSKFGHISTIDYSPRFLIRIRNILEKTCKKISIAYSIFKPVDENGKLIFE